MKSSHSFWISTAVMAAAVLVPHPSNCAEVRLEPVLSVSEVYDDNIFNDEDNEVSEFITRFRPSLGLSYEAARLTADFNYTLDYRFYAKGEGEDETVHFLHAQSLFTLKENLAFLDILEEYSRVSRDPSRDFTEENLFNDSRLANQNLFSISPYLQFRLSERTNLRTGYRYVNISYDEESAEDKDEHLLFAEGGTELTSTLTARYGYNFDYQDSEADDFRKHDIWGGLRLQYQENSFIFGNIGYTFIDYSSGFNDENIFWDAGLTHDFGVWRGTATTGIVYTEDPDGSIFRTENYRISVVRTTQRGDLTGSVYVTDYYDVRNDILDTRSFGASVGLRHEMTERLTGNLAFSAQKFEEKDQGTYTRLFIGTLGLGYELATNIVSSLTYQRLDSHSPQVQDDRYETNRIFLDLTWTF